MNMDPWAGRSGNCTLEQLQQDPDNFRPRTAPFDPRFPTTNQTRHCWQAYVDFYKCIKLKGADYEPCHYFRRVYKSMCPMDWVDNWDELMKANKFPWTEHHDHYDQHNPT